MSSTSPCLKAPQPLLIQPVDDIPLQQQNEFIQFALKCLENRIKYGCSYSLTSSWETREYLRLQLALEKNEIFAVLFLNNKHRVLAFEKLFHGTINTTTVHTRVVLQQALFHNAAAIILAHNHPSGSLYPSDDDKSITRALQSALAMIDVRILNHVIVSVEGSVSFAEQGFL